MKLLNSLLALILVLPSLYGCAPAVIGGAAATTGAVHDRRTVGTYVDDQGIELKASSAIHGDEELNKQTHINIISVNGVVLMVGQAPTESLRQQAQNIVSGIEKVRHVHNELVIAAPSSLTARSNDTLITAKVKTSLFGIKGLPDYDPTRTKVVTEDGVVYLMGLLYRNEADAVSERTRQVGGVEKVVELFEYLD
ncbi:MAG: BON domain-containing protein [Gammaproteobacteria bacterium]|nr:BON domain-containing protein [Gammaproteobacteria bacterium]